MAGMSKTSSDFTKVLSLEHDPVKKNKTILSGSYSGDIPEGYPLGKVTASGKFRPVTVSALSASVSSSTSATLTDAKPFKVGDSIKVGTANATTLVAVNKSTGLVEFAAAQTATTGAAVTGQDGSATARGLTLFEATNVDSADAPATVLLHGSYFSYYCTGLTASVKSELEDNGIFETTAI